jgi:hypothetical protein
VARVEGGAEARQQQQQQEQEEEEPEEEEEEEEEEQQQQQQLERRSGLRTLPMPTPVAHYRLILTLQVDLQAPGTQFTCFKGLLVQIHKHCRSGCMGSADTRRCRLARLAYADVCGRMRTHADVC